MYFRLRLFADCLLQRAKFVVHFGAIKNTMQIIILDINIY
jgi:hypothetical protein